MFKFKPYTETELTELNKFTVYLNYLGSLSSHIDGNLHRQLDSYRLVTTSTKFLSIKSKPNHSEIEKIEKLLRNAWFTEIQLNFNRDNPEFAKYSNHWASVQVYYSIYLALRSLFISMKLITSHSHSPTLKQISDEIENHSALFVSPWNITCTGDTKGNSHSYINLPSDVKIGKISPLANSNNFFDSYALFLKSTRKKQIEEKRKEWLKRSKRKKQPNAARGKMIAGLSPTTVFDCLYRLRIRSNYQDAEPFLITIENDDRAARFNYSLRNITHHLLQQVELLIARHLGKKQYDVIISRFTKTGDFVKHSDVKNRWEFLSSLF